VARKIILKQGLFALLIVIATTIFYGENTGISVGIGCAVTLVPCFIFYKIFFTRRKHLYPTQIIKRFYLAAIVKFLALIFLFISAAQWGELETNKFFLSFVVMQIYCWGSYLMLLRNGTLQ
jgi:F0F1-type ATP synthase assembly protein I